jgi:short-subunit dehydrogenase
MSASLTGVAVVTGASSGIGRAVAQAMAAHGVSLCLSGRDEARLQATARELASRATQVLVHAADLRSNDGICGLAERIRTGLGRVDVLVHAAGTLRLGDVEKAGWDDLDEQYAVNLRAPFLLTKALLPLLKEARGQVVFVNSTAGLAAGVDNALYAATKQALRSLAGSLRDQLGPAGLRVLSVYPGRTDTPMQERVHAYEGIKYDGRDLLSPGDVAEVIVSSLLLPRQAEVTDVVVRPTRQPVSGRNER